MFGDKPYDKNIMPVESFPVAIAAMGEGFHNYHVRMKTTMSFDQDFHLLLFWFFSMSFRKFVLLPFTGSF
jgi:fatty-acid desaturase